MVNTDLCGPIVPQSYCGDTYFILFVDDYSRMMTVMYLKEKYEAFKMFKWVLVRVEKETSKNLKCLRSKRGGYFTSNEFEFFCNDRNKSFQEPLHLLKEVDNLERCSKDTHLHLEPLHKMELLKEETNLSWIVLGI